MNDLHGSKDLLDPRTSKFRVYAKKNNLCRIAHRPTDGYFDQCFDYNKPEISNRILAYMIEQLEQYDVDGIELDFQREAYCFKPGEETEGREIVNDIIRSLKNTTSRLSVERNHRIGIMVRVPSNPIEAYDMGFDIYTWAKEKLVDMVVVTPRFTTCDSTMPIESWVRMFEDYDMEITAGLDIFSASYEHSMKDYTCNTVEMATGYAVQYHCAGSKKIYLFNYFDDPSLDGIKPKDTMAFRDTDFNIELSTVYNGLYDTSPRPKCYHKEFMSAVGSLDTCIKLPRRHIITFQDTYPIWKQGKTTLPLRISNENKHPFVNVKTGEIPKDRRAYILVGIDGANHGEDVSIWCNCVKCKFVRTTKIYPRMTHSPVYVYEIMPNSYKSFNQVIELSSNSGNITVDYLEIRIQN